MKPILYILTILLSPFLLQGQDRDFINGLGLENGSKVISSPKSYQYNPKRHENISVYTPESLIDDRESSLWCSEEESKFPFEFVFEMADVFQVQSLYFDNRCDELYEGVATERIKVEFSTTGPNDGYSEVLDIKLNENESNSIKFDDQKARWIRLTIKSNHGNKDFVELKNFQAWGSFVEKNQESKDISGTWNSNWGWVSLHEQENGNYYGCYEFQDGIINIGSISKGRKFDFSWIEETYSSQGWASLTINEESTQINGIWGKNESKERYGLWQFIKSSNEPKTCSVVPEVDTTIQEKETIYYVLDLSITNNDNDDPLEGATVLIKDSLGSIVHTLSTDASGNANTSLVDGDYTIQIKKEGFQSITEKLTYIKINKPDDSQTWKAKYSIEAFKVGDSFQLNNIQFERGKFTLLEESFAELDTLVEMLNTHPNMKIQLEGHTDNQGSSRLNKILSEQRVESVRDYILSKGIKANRITGVGYGGTKPIADNRNPEKRQLNRRVEFVITDL